MTHRRPACAALALAVFCWGLCGPLSAQVASLVKDLETGVRFPSGRGPTDFVEVNGRVVFRMPEPSSGLELWGSDGTQQGTEMLADVCPGPCDSPADYVARANGFLFWRSWPGENQGSALWATDGTPEGTSRLTDSDSEVFVSFNRQDPIQPFPVLDERVYFFVERSFGPSQLWSSDGTPAGTMPIVDVGIGASNLTRVDEALYFLDDSGSLILWTSDGTSEGTRMVTEITGYAFAVHTAAARNRFLFTTEGAELWSSDGTAEGTMQLTDFPGFSPFGEGGLQELEDEVIFIADDVVHGQELWRSDGTVEGTRRITEFGYHLSFEEGTSVHRLGDEIFFIADDGLTGRELWKTRGTPASTTQVADLCPGGCSGLFASTPRQAGSHLLFTGVNDDLGRELYMTGPETEGAVLLLDLCEGFCSGVEGLISTHDKLYFIGTSADSKSELWTSDGTFAGTRPITRASFPPPGFGALPQSWMARSDDLLYFRADDGVHGVELWVSEGTPGSERLLSDLTQSHPAGMPSSLTARRDDLHFFASNQGRPSLFRTKGEEADTIPVSMPHHCLALDPAIAASGLIFYSAHCEGGNELWRTDGSDAGTLRLHALSNPLRSDQAIAHQDRFYFLQGYGEATEVWESDGTPEGTRLAFAVSQLGRTTMWSFSSVGDSLFFLTQKGAPDFGTEVWRSDGTLAGSEVLMKYPVGHRENAQFTEVRDLVYFISRRHSEGELWRTDSTPEGTFEVGPGVYDIRQIVSLRDEVYFWAATPLGDSYALWKSDGTDAGTGILHEFEYAEYEFDPIYLTPTEDFLFFVADDGEHGRELWRTDGSEAGTVLVRDILPGSTSSSPYELTPAGAGGSEIFFVAHNGLHGFELWRSDGTAEGTRLVHDIAPGAISSSPEQLTATDHHLYFSADDGLSGRELWALPLDPGADLCTVADRAVCLQQNRFRVEMAWRTAREATGSGHPVRLTPETATFWFFREENIETIVKMLDGRSQNEHFWMFYGALSNVEYALTVTDTETGSTRRYRNFLGRFGSVADTFSFGPRGTSPSSAAQPDESLIQHSALFVEPSRVPAFASGSCAPSPNRLCLNQGRFAVEASWRDFSGNQGIGTVRPLTDDTGSFWFFREENIEVVLKVLDGTGVNGHFWVFYGALSNVEYTLEVTDTVTGERRTYFNPARQLASVGDTQAF